MGGWDYISQPRLYSVVRGWGASPRAWYPTGRPIGALSGSLWRFILRITSHLHRIGAQRMDREEKKCYASLFFPSLCSCVPGVVSCPCLISFLSFLDQQKRIQDFEIPPTCIFFPILLFETQTSRDFFVLEEPIDESATFAFS